jgi:hypothetical protein
LLPCMSPVVAPFGHARRAVECRLLRVQRTCRSSRPISVFDRCCRKSPSRRTCRFSKDCRCVRRILTWGITSTQAELLGGLPTLATRAFLAKACYEPISARLLPWRYFRLFRQHRRKADVRRKVVSRLWGRQKLVRPAWKGRERAQDLWGVFLRPNVEKSQLVERDRPKRS